MCSMPTFPVWSLSPHELQSAGVGDLKHASATTSQLLAAVTLVRGPWRIYIRATYWNSCRSLIALVTSGCSQLTAIDTAVAWCENGTTCSFPHINLVCRVIISYVAIWSSGIVAVVAYWILTALAIADANHANGAYFSLTHGRWHEPVVAVATVR